MPEYLQQSQNLYNRLSGTSVPGADLSGVLGNPGSLISTRENLGVYQWVNTQNLAPNGQQVINSIGGGQWQRLQQASQQWCGQPAWTIDPVNGNDLSPSVLKTWAEFAARTQPQGTIRQNTTISILGDLSESLNWNGFIGSFDTANLDISSPSTAWTQTGGGTITTFTSLVPTTQQNALVDDTGGAFTGKEGQRIRITSGASINATAWILKVNSATQVELAGDFQRLNSLADTSGAIVTPIAGVTYVIETLPRMGSVSMQIQSPGTLNTGAAPFTQLTMRDLAIDKIGQAVGGRDCNLNILAQGPSAQFRMLRCRFKGWRVTTLISGAVALGCLFQNDSLLSIDSVLMTGGGFLGLGVGSALSLNGICQFAGNYVVRNSFGASAGLVGIVRDASVNLLSNSSLGCFDNSTGPGISMNTGAGFFFTGPANSIFRGNGNAGFGGVIAAARLMQYGTTKPIITGALGDWQIGGATVAYAAIPFFDVAKACGLVTL